MRSYTSLVRHEGNSELFLFVELSILGLLRGWPVHVHVEGLRGTGKTTILRAARAILPPLTRIKGCPYNCDPARPHCPLHAGLSLEEIGALGTEDVPTPLLEISHAAKIATVVGTLDLKRLTDTSKPEAALLPGTLPMAHRGIVFVDEINRLADTSPELTDVLLDVMGTKPGHVQIEESGLAPASVPVQVSVWAASNPDEDPGPLAEIRRQLSDRFDFVVKMGRPQRMDAVLDILGRGSIATGASESDDLLRAQLLAKATEREVVSELPGEVLTALAQLYIAHHLESLRAVEALKMGALLHAVWRGQRTVDWSNITAVAAAALRHRVRSEELAAILSELEGPVANGLSQAAGVATVKGQGSGNQGINALSGGAPRQRRWGWCSSLWDRWRRKSTFGTGSGGRTAGGGSQCAGSGHQSFPNPLDLPLVAPPEPARPLSEIDPTRAITAGEVGTGDVEQ